MTRYLRSERELGLEKVTLALEGWVPFSTWVEGVRTDVGEEIYRKVNHLFGIYLGEQVTEKTMAELVGGILGIPQGMVSEGLIYWPIELPELCFYQGEVGGVTLLARGRRLVALGGMR